MKPLVILVVAVKPRIPVRQYDYAACYPDDPDNMPVSNLGWGKTAQEAAENLMKLRPREFIQ